MIPAALICLGLIFAFAGAHVHDWDASLYTVLVRHLAADGELFRLHFLPSRWPEFYEHPPFYFWVCALFARVFGEGILPWLNGLFGCMTLALTYAFTRRLASERAAIAAMLVLGTTESFFRYQARTRIDVLFCLLLTAAPYAFFLRRYLLASVLCLCAFFTKGPPAIVAPIVGLAWITLADRRVPWRAALLCTATIALPIIAFFAWEPRWWDGYVRAQVLSSLGGARADANFQWYTMPSHVLMRFWPGLPLLPFAFLQRARLRHACLLLFWAGLIVAGYSLPSRGFWWYVVPAFVPLAMLSGLGMDWVLERLPPVRGFGRVLSGLAVVSLIGALVVWPRFVLPPCPFGHLPARADALTAGDETIAFLIARRSEDDLGILFPSHVHRVVSDTLEGSNVAVVEREIAPADWEEIDGNERFALMLRRRAP